MQKQILYACSGPASATCSDPALEEWRHALCKRAARGESPYDRLQRDSVHQGAPISMLAGSFLDGALQLDPQDRSAAAVLKKHAYIADVAGTDPGSSQDPLLRDRRWPPCRQARGSQALVARMPAPWQASAAPACAKAIAAPPSSNTHPAGQSGADWALARARPWPTPISARTAFAKAASSASPAEGIIAGTALGVCWRRRPGPSGSL